MGPSRFYYTTVRLTDNSSNDFIFGTVSSVKLNLKTSFSILGFVLIIILCCIKKEHKSKSMSVLKKNFMWISEFLFNYLFYGQQYNSHNTLKRKKMKRHLAEQGFDPRTSGLWAQHASTAPLC